MTQASFAATTSPTRTILVLALAPAIGLGIGRFAYALVLPDMRASLDWTYVQAGWMNTVNAGGYLVGALGAAWFARRFGTFRAILWGSLTCVVALGCSALSGNFLLLSAARFFAGTGAAIAFVAGGAMAAAVSERDPDRRSVLLGLFYAGAGIGLVISGAGTPFLLDRFGPGSWWIAWAALAAVSGLLAAPLAVARLEATAPVGLSTVAPVPVRSMALLLAGYSGFGAGYVGYMTFMVAWVQDVGGGPLTQAAFWSLIGIGAIASPWIWSGNLSALAGGRAVAGLTAVTLLGAVLPLTTDAVPIILLSALLFGTAFFAVVAATTAFVRRNMAQPAWPAGIAVLTVAFGSGQTLGPIVSGAVTDLAGDLETGLWVSGGMLLAGALLAALQQDLG